MTFKKYFKRQFQSFKLFLEHDEVSDFYTTSLQRNPSAVPLLLIRTLIFVGTLSTVIASIVLTTRSTPFKYWLIYLTHWGIILNAIAAGFGFVISATAFIKGSIESSLGLPWYIKTYWVFYNIAIPIAFFITIFYWSLLTGIEQEFAINFTLDIFIHAVNSILMLVLLLSTRHPSHLLHFYFSIGLGVTYLIFSIIYYYAGGTNVFGDHWIYPLLDWSRPGMSTIVTVLSALGILILHVLVVALTEGRNALTRRFAKDTTSYNTNEAYY